MANIKQAKKRVIQAEKSRKHNMARRSKMRTFMKKTLKAVQNGDVAEAKSQYHQLEKLLDRYAMKGLIHKNKAARHKSRICAKIKALDTAA